MFPKKILFTFAFLCATRALYAGVCVNPVTDANTALYAKTECFDVFKLRSALACIKMQPTQAAIACVAGNKQKWTQKEFLFHFAIVGADAAIHQRKEFFTYYALEVAEFLQQAGPSWREQFARYYANNIFDDDGILEEVKKNGLALDESNVFTLMEFSASRVNKRIFSAALGMTQATGTALNGPLFTAGNAPDNVFGYGPPTQHGYDVATTRKELVEMLFTRGADVNNACSSAWNSTQGYFPITCAQKLVHWGKPHPLSYALLLDKSNEAYVCAAKNDVGCLLRLYSAGVDFKTYNTFPFLDSLMHFAVKNSNLQTVRALFFLGGFDGTEISLYAGETFLTALAKRDGVYDAALTQFIFSVTPDSITYTKNTMGYTLFEMGPNQGFTPLALALCKNNLPLAQALVSQKRFDKTKIGPKICRTEISLDAL